MLGIHDFWLFILSGLLLNVTPGPDTAYIVGRSIQMGWRAGVLAGLGICAGCFLHVFAAALGLSALLTTSATAFLAVKWIGAAYLAYLGITMLLCRRQSSTIAAAEGVRGDPSRWAVFSQGALTNVLNPKVALFFLAFLPQFVDADAPRKAFAFILLGTVFISNSLLWCLLVAVVAARGASRIRRSSAMTAWINRTIGGLFVYLGIRIAMMEAR
jgi:threonine/homoserine/homoserine lactone efflux protein